MKRCLNCLLVGSLSVALWAALAEPGRAQNGDNININLNNVHVKGSLTIGINLAGASLGGAPHVAMNGGPAGAQGAAGQQQGAPKGPADQVKGAKDQKKADKGGKQNNNGNQANNAGNNLQNMVQNVGKGGGKQQQGGNKGNQQAVAANQGGQNQGHGAGMVGGHHHHHAHHHHHHFNIGDLMREIKDLERTVAHLSNVGGKGTGKQAGNGNRGGQQNAANQAGGGNQGAQQHHGHGAGMIGSQHHHQHQAQHHHHFNLGDVMRELKTLERAVDHLAHVGGKGTGKQAVNGNKGGQQVAANQGGQNQGHGAGTVGSLHRNNQQPQKQQLALNGGHMPNLGNLGKTNVGNVGNKGATNLAGVVGKVGQQNTLQNKGLGKTGATATQTSLLGGQHNKNAVKNNMNPFQTHTAKAQGNVARNNINPFQGTRATAQHTNQHPAHMQHNPFSRSSSAAKGGKR